MTEATLAVCSMTDDEIVGEDLTWASAADVPDIVNLTVGEPQCASSRHVLTYRFLVLLMFDTITLFRTRFIHSQHDWHVLKLRLYPKCKNLAVSLFRTFQNH